MLNNNIGATLGLVHYVLPLAVLVLFSVVQTIPQNLEEAAAGLGSIAVAEACGLPLVELPWELRFSEISQVVLARLLDDQYAALRESLTLQQRLTRLVVNGADRSSQLPRRGEFRISPITSWALAAPENAAAAIAPAPVMKRRRFVFMDIPDIYTLPLPTGIDTSSKLVGHS